MTWKHPRDVARERQSRPRSPIFPDTARFKPWNACVVAFLAQLNPAARTSREYEFYLRHFFALHPEKTPNDISRQEVEKWLNMPPKNNTISVPTYNARLNALSSFYKYATTYEYEFRGQWKTILTRQPPTNNIGYRKESFRSRAMTDDEMHRFFRAIADAQKPELTKKRDRALFLLYFWTGRRKREIAELLWGDIERRVFYQRGKNIEVWIYKWRGKGHLSKDDSAQIPVEAVEALIEYLEADGRWGNMAASDPVFPGRWGNSLTLGAIGNACKQYMTAAGLSESGVHRFRHTRAVVTYQETGNDIVEVAQLLRHNSIEMTRHYVETAQGQIDTTATKLSRRFGDL